MGTLKFCGPTKKFPLRNAWQLQFPVPVCGASSPLIRHHRHAIMNRRLFSTATRLRHENPLVGDGPSPGHRKQPLTSPARASRAPAHRLRSPASPEGCPKSEASKA